MDREEKRRYSSSEITGAVIALTIIAAATTPVIFSYRDKWSQNQLQNQLPPRFIVDTEAAKRNSIINRELPITPSPSPSPYVHWD